MTDTVTPTSPERDRVDVVVTHYEAEDDLARVLDALRQQTYPSELIRITVTDDGSAQVPQVPAGVRLVTQPDEGFRAALARNRGVPSDPAPYLLFLDGDSIPAAHYCAAMVAALRDADTGHGALVVGTRHHIDADAPGADVAALVRTGDPDAANTPRLADPQWLLDGYRRTDHLRSAGDEDWRLIISACLGITRELWQRVGGFDASLCGYGGEDWELAYRCWNLGAQLRHEPSAVVWHNGPDAGERPQLAALKASEQLALARRIPLPSVRGTGGIWQQPRLVLECDATFTGPTQTYAVLESWLRLGDIGVWLPAQSTNPFPDDPRIHTAPVPEAIRQRCAIHIRLQQPLMLRDTSTFLSHCAQHPVTAPGVDATPTRAHERGEPAQALPDGIVERLADEEHYNVESHAWRYWV